MKIAIASGKGGTGKTTVAVNMALSLDNVQLLDCDVEEPDCKNFLDMHLENAEVVESLLPKVNEEACDRCGKCSELCHCNAIVTFPSGVMPFPELCRGCGLCAIACPLGAISEERKVIGEVRKGDGEIDFYEGILNVGEPFPAPVIRAVKERARVDKTVIIDVPPGNACPAIAAISGTDFCVLVTEPTPFGLHDLKLSVRALRELEIPHAAIVNRVGIGDSRVEKYCEGEGIPILMRIPQSRRIEELYSRGVPFVREMPEWKERFSQLHKRISEMTQ